MSGMSNKMSAGANWLHLSCNRSLVGGSKSFSPSFWHWNGICFPSALSDLNCVFAALIFPHVGSMEVTPKLQSRIFLVSCVGKKVWSKIYWRFFLISLAPNFRFGSDRFAWFRKTTRDYDLTKLVGIYWIIPRSALPWHVPCGQYKLRTALLSNVTSMFSSYMWPIPSRFVYFVKIIFG